MISRAVAVLLMGLMVLYKAAQLPPPQDAVLAAETATTCTRIRLRDGRYLAYRERGIARERSNYKVIVVHGFGSSKEMSFQAPQEQIEKLGIYFLQFDRAGYGDSDPNMKRSTKSEAYDIQELADQLKLGPKFYVIGVSMGSYPAWSCLKHIPHRLEGMALVVPVINYSWKSLPQNLTRLDFRRKLIQWTLWLANYAPELLHWWVTREWLPSTTFLEKNPTFFSDRDIDVLKKTPEFPMLTKDKLRRRQVFDTLLNDFTVSFGNWEFDPLDLSNPFPRNESFVHIWQGYEDKVVPFRLQRYVAGKLPWIRYHEIPDGGHLIVHYKGVCEAILWALLNGEHLPDKQATAMNSHQ
ncbi:AB hydrolase-1 domain-containing protein, partial [Psidium guajava]